MRRGFSRPVRRMFAADVPPLLRRANQMLSAGNYAEAASTYEQLARAAEARGGPRAPLFYIQAGRSHILAGHIADGLEYLERGLGLFAMRGQQVRAANVGRRIIAELDGRGLKTEAKQIGGYLEELVPGLDEEIATSGAAPFSQRRSLPAHCPGCGAPLRPDEVEWLEGGTAACAYCGSPVHEE